MGRFRILPQSAGESPVIATTQDAVSTQTSPYSLAPTLSIVSGTPGGTWLTTVRRASDDSAVSVTGDTTTTPTATLTSAAVLPGEAFHITTTYTDPGGLTDEVSCVVYVAGVAVAPTVAIDAVTNKNGLDPIALSADVTDGVAPYTYAWSAIGPDSATGSFDDATSATPTFTPDVNGYWVIKLTVTDANLLTGSDTEDYRAGYPPPPVELVPAPVVSEPNAAYKVRLFEVSTNMDNTLIVESWS